MDNWAVSECRVGLALSRWQAFASIVKKIQTWLRILRLGRSSGVQVSYACYRNLGSIHRSVKVNELSNHRKFHIHLATYP